MAISFDGDNTLITLESGVTELDVQTIYSFWKEWVQVGDNGKYLAAFRTVGGDPLSSIINAGAYYFLRNDYGWRIKPPEEDITIYTTGNLAVEDTTQEAFVPTVGDFTAAILGLQPVTQGVTPEMGDQLAYGSYNNGITFDVVNGLSLAQYEVFNISNPGSPAYPLNNTADVISKAESLSFNLIYMRGAITLDDGDWAEGYTFKGRNPVVSSVNILGLANINNCEFQELTVNGVADNFNIMRNCLMLDITSYDGFFVGCAFQGTVTLGGTSQTTVEDGFSNVAGGLTPEFNMGGSGSSFAVRGYKGGMEITNKTGTDEMSIDMESGQVIFADTCIAGAPIVRGVGKLVDNSGPLCVVDSTDYLQASIVMDGIERASYIGKEGTGASIKPSTGTDSIIWPYGTRKSPCATVHNAHEICEDQGFRNIYCLESITINEPMTDGYTFFGDNPQTVNVNMDVLADVANCKFQDAYVTGQLSTANIIWECILGSTTNVNGFVYKSALLGPLVISDAVSINKCWVAPTSVEATVIIDFNNLPNEVFISQFEQGKIKVINMTTDSVMHMAGTGGKLIIDASCTGGTVAHGGAIMLTNNGTPDVVMNATISKQTWNEPEGKDVHLAETGRRRSVGLVDTIYEDDNITPRKEFDITKDGGGSVIEVFPR